MLKTSLQSTEEESQRMDVEKVNVDEKMQILEKSIMQLHTKTKGIRDDIINHASQQKTIEKSSANLIKQTKVAYEQISKKEVEIEDIANEISRVRIDNLNTQSQNELLQKKLDDLINELKDKEREVEKFEGDIKQRHITIAKKQHRVDRLNRQLDELKKKNGEDENAGPLEAKKNNIEKEINEMEDKITQVQKEWIANQTELIEQQNTLSTIGSDCESLRTQKTILEQKKLRLNNSVQGHEKEIRSLEVALKNLDFEMNKLNDLYYKNTAQQTKMTNDNFNIENEFKQKLKELENESIKLESNISTLKEEKADILAEIVEAERQILLWERKIQLEREMQETLDPNIGQTEIVAMKIEIHRMELRYETLRKKQEEMIKDMERAVFKRETIQLKYLPKVEKKNAQDKSSQGKLSRQIANLKQTLRHTTENTMQLDTTIEQRLKELEQVNDEIEQARNDASQYEELNQKNQVEMLATRMDRSKTLYDTLKFQTMAKRYDEIATNKFKSNMREEQAIKTLEDVRT